MEDIRLKRLTLDNFKGQRHIVLDFDGRSASIYGDNAAGKTTIYDALTWLLFGKDCRGQSSFEVKPLDSDGNVADHAAVTAVEAVLIVPDGEMALKKTYYEKWSTKRGSAMETYDGNTSDYYVDAVPVKKYEYERQVGELVNESVFRLLTSVTYFCGELDWRERRRVLFEMCAVAPDVEIMAGDARFAALSAAMGRLGLDDYKKKLQAERKVLVGVRNDVPTRMDECRKTVEALSGIDFAALRAERDQRAVKRDQLAAELLKLDHSTLIDAKRNERDALKVQLVRLEQDNNAHRRAQQIPPADDGSALRREKEGLERSVVRWSNEKTAADREIVRCEEEVAACRDRWKEVNGRSFTGATCPTCGQTLLGDLLEMARSSFEAEKAAELRDVVTDSERFKSRKADAEARREALICEMVAAENRVAELVSQLAEIKPVEQPQIVDLPGYADERKTLLEDIEAAENAVAALSGESATVKAEVQGKISTLSEEIAAIEGSLAKESLLAYTMERMDKLRTDAQSAAEQLESLDKLLFLCDEFTRYKTGFIEENVNSRFAAVRWRLFAEQVNGGVSECCDATVDGVPYASLNNGARINAGLDVIDALSKHYGVSVPLFIDNAESVTALLAPNTQMIRLVVSAGDKELRCEYGT